MAFEKINKKKEDSREIKNSKKVKQKQIKVWGKMKFKTKNQKLKIL